MTTNNADFYFFSKTYRVFSEYLEYPDATPLPSCCISGSDGASKQLLVATLAALFCSFCNFCKEVVPIQPQTGQQYLKEGPIRLVYIF